MPFTPDFRTLGLLGAVLAIAMATGVLVGMRTVGVSDKGSFDAGYRRLAWFAVGLSAATWVLLVFGSSVRVNGAGLACPDWPACFGQVIPDLDWKVSLEFGHRVYAGFISLGFLGLAGLAIHRSRDLWPLFAVGALVLGVQIVLGGLTVLHLLAEWTVASHLVCGNTFSAVILVIALTLRDRASGAPLPGVTIADRIAATLMAPLVIGQIALGGLVASSHAGLACGTWPGCNGDAWFPTFEGLIGLQVTHRIVAYTLLAGSLGVLGVTRARGRVGRAAVVLVLLVLVQAAIGVSNVLLRLPVEVTLLHSAGAAALVLATTWLNYEAWRAPVVSVAPVRAGRSAALVEAP